MTTYIVFGVINIILVLGSLYITDKKNSDFYIDNYDKDEVTVMIVFLFFTSYFGTVAMLLFVIVNSLISYIFKRSK